MTEIQIREPVVSDKQRIVKIYQDFYSYDFPLDVESALSMVVAEKNEKILGFGWLTPIVEANVILDLNARPRDKFEALRKIIACGEATLRKAGFDQMHVFPKDERFTNILKKHLEFRDITGDCLVKNLDKNG